MQIPTGQTPAGIRRSFQPKSARIAACVTKRLKAIRDLVDVLEAWETTHNEPAGETLGTSRQTRRACDLLGGTRPPRAVVCQGAGYLRCRHALSPIDLIPDFVPILGYMDDVIIVPLGILIVVKLIPPEIMAEHRALAAAAQDRPVSRAGAIVIAIVWTACIVFAGWLCYRSFVS